MSPLTGWCESMRHAHERSQAAFGASIGLARSHVNAIEKGKRYAPGLETLTPLITELNLGENEQFALRVCAELSSRGIRVPPDAPQEAFRFISTLEACWAVLTTADFEQLQNELYSLHPETLKRLQLDEEKIMT